MPLTLDWLPPLDLAALSLHLAVWVGYSVFADRWGRRGRPCLSAATARLRVRWMRALCDRDNRITDSGLMASLMRSVSFFASASVLILGGIVAMLGAGDRAYEMVRELPMLARSSQGVFEVKLVILTGVFVYAFFQMTWSLRQFNYCCILVGAAPVASAPAAVKDRFAEQAGRLQSLAGRTFNRGLRAYYFALAMMTWFIHSGIFAVTTLAVVAVLYRREFRSASLDALVTAFEGETR